MGFHGEAFLAPRPIPKLEYHPLSAVSDCLFNLFVATLHIGVNLVTPTKLIISILSVTVHIPQVTTGIITPSPNTYIFHNFLWEYNFIHSFLSPQFSNNATRA